MTDKNWGELHCRCGSARCYETLKKCTDLSSSTQKEYIKLDVIPNYILAKI
jgi:hypothetical protein